MTTEKSEALAFLESLTGGPLTLGRAIASTRRCDGYTATRMAKKLGITPQHLCDLEKGRRRVSPARAYRWAERLGYSGDAWMRLAVQDYLRKVLRGPASGTAGTHEDER
jgi:transcriptional regulator with XRE-family HTH domain